MSVLWFAVGAMAGVVITIAALCLCAWGGTSDADMEHIMEDELERRLKE